MIGNYAFHFGQPWWLLAALPAAPAAWFAWRNLASLGAVRRVGAIILRCLVILVLAGLLARPALERKHRKVTLLMVVDRSQSVPQPLQDAAREFLTEAVARKPADDRLSVIDVAEAASIVRLPDTLAEIPKRNPSLTGGQTNLACGVQMAMAIMPPDTAGRILLVSDGNETAGDVREAARVAAANGIPVDVLALTYRYENEVVFRRLAVPTRARSGQTINLRFVLGSTGPARGRLLLSLNGRPVDLDPAGAGVGAQVDLAAGTNVKTISLPVGMRGVHEFEATFVPDDPAGDRLTRNNRAGGVTFVAGPGHVLVVDGDGQSGAALTDVLQKANIETRHVPAAQIPTGLPALLDIDAIILANVDNSELSYRQQEMLCRYVTELGGGLVMVGGPKSFGAGGWIGSPVAKVLPVDPDPPQKKQLPKGALVLIMHACEMPRGNYWGKTVAIAGVNALSRLDLVGVVDYSWNAGAASNWVYPLSLAGDKKAVTAAIKKMVMGDMPDFGAPMQAAYNKLSTARAAQKHVIIISDGDPAMPSKALLAKCRRAGITVTGVAVFPHSQADIKSLLAISRATGGRFYNVKDPNKLPQIFVKEAQVVRRTLIVEEPVTPRMVSSLGEVLRGIGSSLPVLDGYVLTGPKGGPTQMLLTTETGDPLLATGQAGLGRTVAFTSTADGRWAGNWLAWDRFGRFWEQTVRWAARPGQSSDCEVFADVQGRNVTLTVDAVDAEGRFVQLAGIRGQVIAPDMSVEDVPLRQVGPGRYIGRFRAGQSGSYLVNLQHRTSAASTSSPRAGSGEPGLTQTVVTVPYAPEFRDLSDNAPLLAEVARATGGRVLGGEPGDANLFDRASLRFPTTPLPVTKPLIFLWLVLFLLDVAVRRIAVDLRAMLRWFAATVGRLRRVTQADKTIDRLRARRKKLREQLAGRGAEAMASRKYEASGRGPAEELPMADATAAPPEARPPAEKPAQAGAPPPAPEQTHLDRLLKAKRQARDRMAPEDTDKDE